MKFRLEILFRAKYINSDEWVYGLPTYDSFGKINQIITKKLETVHIKPETLRQRIDRVREYGYAYVREHNNNTEIDIYMGDIVDVHKYYGLSDSGEVYEVKIDSLNKLSDLYGSTVDKRVVVGNDIDGMFEESVEV